MKTSANILQTPVYFSKDFTFHLSQSLSSTNWVAKISNYTWTMAPWAQLSPKCVMDGLELCGSQKGFRCAEPQLCLLPSPVLVSQGGWAELLSLLEGRGWHLSSRKQMAQCSKLCWDGLVKAFLHLNPSRAVVPCGWKLENERGEQGAGFICQVCASHILIYKGFFSLAQQGNSLSVKFHPLSIFLGSVGR